MVNFIIKNMDLDYIKDVVICQNIKENQILILVEDMDDCYWDIKLEIDDVVVMVVFPLGIVSILIVF